MTDEHVFIVTTPGPSGNDPCATRHEAVGKAAILDSVCPNHDPEVRVRDRYATDPV